MKTPIIGLLFSLLVVTAFTQNLNVAVHGIYTNPITKEKLSKARSMADIISYYPSSWIESYNSAEITVISSSSTFSAKSANDILSKEQLKLISSLDFGTEIVINIGYQRMNPITNKTEDGNMHYKATVIPETEAVYSDGYEELTHYLKSNTVENISADDSKDLHQAVVRFTVDEAGEIVNANIFKSSGKPGIDKLLLEAINDMPKWRPAADSQGHKVRQEFEFTLSDSSDGC
ncbi:MAG: energy transducer TonB [Bacteroidales bacterium]|nr:energy transducer TonB [Bacteroidales bacterium]